MALMTNKNIKILGANQDFGFKYLL